MDQKKEKKNNTALKEKLFVILKHPATFFSLAFFFVNASTSHAFYHVNSYKILLTAIVVTIVAVRCFFVPLSRINRAELIKHWCLLLLPILTTVPGLILHRLNFNYNFEYELASNLIVIIWAICLSVSIHKPDDTKPLLIGIGITIIYACLWALLERTGFHPLDWSADPVTRVKSTFGNTNYFAGFLIITVPLALAFGLPEIKRSTGGDQGFAVTFSKLNTFFLITFFFGLAGLYTTMTRAAIFGFGLGILCVIYFAGMMYASKTWRKRLMRLLYALIAIALVLFCAMLFFGDSLPQSRFTNLFTLEAWYTRIGPWQTAISSITQSPAVGYGLGSSYNLFFSFVNPDTRLFHQQRSYNHVHSEPLEYFQESGLLGVVVYLLFWGLIIFGLLKTFRNSDSDNTTVSRLVIGILGGLVAYHTQSFFSVAPRMMVVKLPLFTSIGLSLAVFQLRAATRVSTTERKLQFRLKAFFPVLVGIVVVWVLAIPWLSGQNRFVRIMKQPPSLQRVKNLENLVRDRGDIYALDYLAKLQIEYRRVNELTNTLIQIEKIIPHYRDSDILSAVQAFMSQKPETAKQLAKAAQNRDKYSLPAIELLMNISVVTNDFAEFKNQFNRLTKHYAFSHKLVPSEEPFINQFKNFVRTDILNKPPLDLITDEDILKILIAEKKAPIDFISQDDRLTIVWDERLIAVLFNKARQNRVTKPPSREDKVKFWSALIQTLARHSYFKLDIYKPDDSKITNQVNVTLKNYVDTKNRFDRENQRLQSVFIDRLRKSPRLSHKGIEKQYTLEKKKRAEDYRLKVEPMLEFLEESSDWERFRDRQGFLNNMVTKTIGVVFQNTK